MNPIETLPQGTFSEFLKSEPVMGTAVDKFKIALYGDNGSQLGWLGQNDDEWAILVTDESKALTLELYPYDQVDYYRVKGTSRYMSVNRNAYIGFYNWSGATGWKLDGEHLISDYNNQKLSLYSKDNQYLYAWDKYNVLNVKLDTK
ncbi:MAG TPA: hypothetical protein VL995_10930 [Cellvibrio sp.]|nr:hypothetical protein [Cellvibrio sp.]